MLEVADSSMLSAPALVDTAESEELRNDASAVNPIVLVPGFLGPAKDDESFDHKCRWFSYWGEAAALGTSNNPILCVWPSGFSSLHDRACEIFYQIKGGTVDYGEDHSARYLLTFVDLCMVVALLSFLVAAAGMLVMGGHTKDFFLVKNKIVSF